MKKKGFTLIELLVVIAIIGILSSVVVVSLNSARAKARDAKRVADLEAVKTALGLYFDSNQTYPDTADVWTDLGPQYLASSPSAPNASTGETYTYVKSADGLSYHLSATLEQVTDNTGVLASDRDCDSSAASTAVNVCNGFEVGVGVTGGFLGTDPIYDVTP